MHTLITVDEKAFMAVVSFCWASSKAAVFKAVTVRASSGEANESAAEVNRIEMNAIILT
jgi:hypothetical protein